MNTSEKLALLRERMRAAGVTHLLVPSDDFHQSEYVSDHFKSRAYISGFTGSAGTLILSLDDARLFTDGRYYIQAERQLEGSGITLMKSGSEGVPTPAEYLAESLREGGVLAFDGRCVGAKYADELKSKLPGSVKFVTGVDFPAQIWPDRPALPANEIWRLDEKYCGRSHSDKLADLRRVLSDKGCQAFVMSSLCDVAWLYNLRGSDVKNTPVFLSFCLVTDSADTLYVNLSAADKIAASLADEGVTLRPYDEFFADLAKLSGMKVLLDRSACSQAMIDALGGCELFDAPNPTLLMKAKKNPTELCNLRRCHIADGLAVTKLMLELKYGEREFDEYSVGEYLYKLRAEAAERVGVTLLDESFGTIAAWGSNAAMMHYTPSQTKSAKVTRTAKPFSTTLASTTTTTTAESVPMLLVDSGGQYLEGTTDITRTFVLGEISPEIKLHYTLTACGMLRLLNLKFLEGAPGASLDVICRQPLWERGIDYRCGTGHGVGYLLSVHEGPNRFQWRTGSAPIEEGMVTTDEPGVYCEGSHGIRIENELIARKAEHNEYGQFMSFENLTFCPIDLDGIEPNLLDRSDIRKLNEYHRSVFEALSPYLCPGDREKLAYLTREI